MYADEQREQLRNFDITKADKSLLVNLEDVMLDREASCVERVNQFASQIKNPYAYRVGNTLVKAAYADNGKTLHEAIILYLKTIKNK